MSKAYRDDVYRLGIRMRLQQLETEVQALQKEAPDLVLSETPIMFVRPELKAAARNGWGGKRERGAYSDGVVAQRTRTQALLDWFEKKTRTPAEVRQQGYDMRGVYQLTHNGYLDRKGNQLTRTRKPFYVEKAVVERARRHARADSPVKKKRGFKAKPNGYSAQRAAQRARTADYLAKYDADEARRFPSLALGSYVRRGYLKPKGDGYVRTPKEFHV